MAFASVLADSSISLLALIAFASLVADSGLNLRATCRAFLEVSFETEANLPML